MTGMRNGCEIVLSSGGRIARPVASACVGALILSGCTTFGDPSAPEPIRHMKDPSGREYVLYRPAAYDRADAWPLIVVCPSSFPDSPASQIREWTQLSEQYGALVAAVKIEFARRGWDGKPTNLTDVLRENDRRILSAVQHIKAGHNVSEDRVLIYGWKGGATTALNSGLLHPEIFRAVAVTRPALPDDSLPGVWTGVDRHQPVQVYYDMDDFVTGRRSANVISWLRSIGVDVSPRTLGSARKSDTADAVLFFQDVIQRVPWLHIRAFTADASKPLEVHFKTKGSSSPRQFRWYFGDGDESVVAEPVHVYGQPGEYHVTLQAAGSAGEMIERTAVVTVPGAGLRSGE